MRWSVEDKLKFIRQYKKHGIVRRVRGCKHKTMCARVRTWTRRYDALGITHTKNKLVTYRDRLKAMYLINQGLTYTEIAYKFEIKDSSTISNWYKLYLKYGSEGLIDKPKGRKPMGYSQHLNSNIYSRDNFVLYNQLRIKEQYVNYIKNDEIEPNITNSFHLIEALKNEHRITDILKAL